MDSNALLEDLARDLTLRHGRGFSRSNLSYMRLFYQRYPICETTSHKLSWSHLVELLKLDDELERSFYEQQAIAEQWSVKELKRQKKSQLFVQKYQLYLPDREALGAEIERTLLEAGQ